MLQGLRTHLCPEAAERPEQEEEHGLAYTALILVSTEYLRTTHIILRTPERLRRFLDHRSFPDFLGIDAKKKKKKEQGRVEI